MYCNSERKKKTKTTTTTKIGQQEQLPTVHSIKKNKTKKKWLKKKAGNKINGLKKEQKMLHLTWFSKACLQVLSKGAKLRERCFLSCHKKKKILESVWRIKPQTFRLCTPMLYQWATETVQWARPSQSSYINLGW